MKSITSLFLGVLILAIIVNYLLYPKQTTDIVETATIEQYDHDDVRTYVALSRFLEHTETRKKELLETIAASQGRALIAIPLLAEQSAYFVNICSFTNRHPRGTCSGAIRVNPEHEIGQLLQTGTPLRIYAYGNYVRVYTDVTFEIYRERANGIN